VKTILVLVGLAIAGSAIAEEHVISVPGEGWRIRFDAPKLTPGEGFVPSVFYGRADRLQVSFFVEPPGCPGGDSDENIYECFTESLRNNPHVDWDTERGNTRPSGGVMVMYISRGEVAGVTGTAFNINLLFPRNGKWADLHTSIASPTDEDVRLLFELVNSVAIEDEVVGATAGE
jgi:hypothetical protein